MDRERLKGSLDLLLLSVFSAGPAHGYAIIAVLRDRSEDTPLGEVPLKPVGRRV
jgi:DNA-binding PadR family transcriptional regulator